MADFTRFDPATNVLSVGDRRLVFHCHHYNVLLQRTVEDALGPATAREVQRAAAAESSRKLLLALFEAEQIEGLEARLARAAQVFGALGFGAANVAGLGLRGGEVKLTASHYATGWRAKLGRSSRPVCHFAAGYFRGALVVASGLDPDRVRSDELACAAEGDSPCLVRVEVL